MQLFFHSRLDGFSVSGSGSCPSQAVACFAVGLARAWRPAVAAQHAQVLAAGPRGACTSVRRSLPSEGYSSLQQWEAYCEPAPFGSGLPSLRGHDLARVTSANSLYAFTAVVAGMCSQHGIPWIIENPARSYMWDTSMMSALPDRGPLLRLWGCSAQANSWAKLNSVL